MHIARLDGTGVGRLDGSVRQFFLRQLLAGLVRDQQGLQALDLLQGKVVGGLSTLISASCLIELLLRDEVVFEHRLGTSVLALGVKAVGLGFLHRCELTSIARRGILWSEPQLRTHLTHQALLTFHLKLQFAFIEENQRLSFFDRVADVGENFRDSSLYLRAQACFLRADREIPPPARGGASSLRQPCRCARARARKRPRQSYSLGSWSSRKA